MVDPRYPEVAAVKYLKLGIVICGAVGVAGLMMIRAVLPDDNTYTILVLAAFGLPVVMAAMGLLKPPFRAWQAGVSLAGFAFAAAKLKIWETIRVIADLPMGVKLMMAGAVLGVIVSVITVLKPEASA
jgi:hypothetical protein